MGREPDLRMRKIAKRCRARVLSPGPVRLANDSSTVVLPALNRHLPYRIEDEEVAAFARDGAICLRGVLDDEWLECLREAVDEAQRYPGPHTQVHREPGESAASFLDYRTSDRIPALRRFLERGPVPGIAARLLESRRVNLYSDNVFVKDPGTSSITPWHQDQPSLNVDGDKLCNVWFALDPIPHGAGLEVVMGSHHWGRWFQGILQLAEDPSSPFEPVPDIAGNRRDYRLLSWPMAPGDCIAFHSLALHGAPGNATSGPRRARGAILLGDDARWGDRAHYMNPPLTGHGLEPGDEMDCAYFPRLSSRD